MPATFKSDASGFLIGDLISGNNELLHTQQQSTLIWKDIRRDVKAIARAVGVKVGASTRTTQVVGPRGVSSPSLSTGRSSVARTAGGDSVAARAPVQVPVGRASMPAPVGRAALHRNVASSSRSTSLAVLTPPSRASNGQFVAGQTRPGSKASTSGAGAVTDGARKSVGDKIGRLSGALGNTSNLDPTLDAAREIKEVVGPLGRGFSTMLGRGSERKKETWFRRILRALTPTKSSAPTVTAGGGGGVLGGALGGIGAMLTGVPAMLAGLLARIFLPIAAVWGSFELGKWIGEKIYKWLDEAGIMAKVFDAFDAIADTFKGAWTNVTSGIDTVVNGIQTAWKTITDGFTTALDSFTVLPKKIGEFFDSLDAAMRNLPIVGKAFGAAMDAAKSTVADAKAGFQEGKSGNMSAPAASASQALARDVGKGVAAASNLGTQARAGFDMARGDGTQAPAAGGMMQRAARAVGGAAGTATGWVLGNTSKNFESGRGGAGTVSTGKGDNGGASYGTYQLSSKAGTLAKFLAQSPYGEQFAGLTPGSPEFNAKWKEIAKTDPSFGGAQHDFMKATHFDPAMQSLKDAGIDLTNQGPAVHDALWSTATQFGPGSAKKGDGAFGIFSKALAGRDASSMSQADIVAAVQDYKAANNSSLFKSSSAAVQAGTLARATNEKGSLLNLAALSPSTLPVAGVNIPPIKVPQIPSTVPPTMPPMEAVVEPAKQSDGAGAGRGVVQVSMPSQPVGQNVGDRALAHIVGGGLGGA